MKPRLYEWMDIEYPILTGLSEVAEEYRYKEAPVAGKTYNKYETEPNGYGMGYGFPDGAGEHADRCYDMGELIFLLSLLDLEE